MSFNKVKSLDLLEVDLIGTVILQKLLEFNLKNRKRNYWVLERMILMNGPSNY